VRSAHRRAVGASTDLSRLTVWPPGLTHEKLALFAALAKFGPAPMRAVVSGSQRRR